MFSFSKAQLKFCLYRFAVGVFGITFKCYLVPKFEVRFNGQGEWFYYNFVNKYFLT